MPGRAVRLLEMSAGFAENKIVTASSVEKAIEQTMNVKISTANVDEEKETLLNLENLLHARMVGQEKAVSVVANALGKLSFRKHFLKYILMAKIILFVLI